MIDQVIAIYTIIDDALKAMRHWEDPRSTFSDAEVITTGVVAARFFGGHLTRARDFYGFRVQVLTTATSVPVELAFLPGEANDTRGLSSLPLVVPAGSEIFMDAGYTDYQAEDDALWADGVNFAVGRKKNSQRRDAWPDSVGGGAGTLCLDSLPLLTLNNP